MTNTVEVKVRVRVPRNVLLCYRRWINDGCQWCAHHRGRKCAFGTRPCALYAERLQEHEEDALAVLLGAYEEQPKGGEIIFAEEPQNA